MLDDVTHKSPAAEHIIANKHTLTKRGRGEGREGGKREVGGKREREKE